VTTIERPVIPIRVQARADAINKGIEESPRNWQREMQALINSKEPTRIRLRKLWALTDDITAFTKGNVACHEGCSHCCHIAVSVLQPEAEMIGQLIGRKPKSPKSDKIGEVPVLPLGYDNPCTFLKDDRCSIYEHRPLTCRIYASVEDNEDPCRLDKPQEVANPNFQYLYMVYIAICDSRKMVVKSDIRNYFPKQS
jgi:Fe-S-cluster containining protein